MVEAICVRYITQQVNWNKTNLKKNFIQENDKIEACILIADEPNDEEEILQNDMLMQDKLNHIYLKIKQLDPINKMVYNYWINGINTSGKLSKHTGLSRQTTWKLIKEMKENIGYEHIIVTRPTKTNKK